MSAFTYAPQPDYGTIHYASSFMKDAQDLGKTFEDTYSPQHPAEYMQLFIPGMCDDALHSPLGSLSTSPNDSESSFGGSSKATSPSSSDRQLPSRSQSISTASLNTINTSPNASDIYTFDPTIMPAPVSVLPSPTQTTTQPMQPNTFMPFMSSMSTMPPMTNMPTITYEDRNCLASPLDSPPTDFIDSLFFAYPPTEQAAPAPATISQLAQSNDELLFDMDELSAWSTNFVAPPLSFPSQQQQQEELYGAPSQERVTAQLETYFRRPDQAHLRRQLESIQGAPWLIAHQKEPNDPATKRSVYLTFLSTKSDGGKASGANGNNYRCLFDGCNKSFDRQDRAIGHIRMHVEHRPFQCNAQCGVADCPERFYCTSYLKSHIKRQKVPCESCGVSFFRNAIKRHKVNCSGRQGLWPWFENQANNTHESNHNLTQF